MKKEVAWFNILISGPSIFTGILAGTNIDRYVVQVPAWRHVSIVSWGAYSRYADLGNGLFLYPFEAIGSFLLLLAVSFIVLKDKIRYKYVALPALLATGFAALGLILTIFAAPVMLNIPTLGDNEILLQQAFDKFHFWGLFRAIAQLLSFFASVWVLKRMITINQHDSMHYKNQV